MQINPLKLLEKEFILLVLQYLHLNPNGRTLEQISSSVDHNVDPSIINSCLKTLFDLGLVKMVQGEEEFTIFYALTGKGRYASEIVWDLFRVIINPQDSDDLGGDVLDFYR